MGREILKSLYRISGKLKATMPKHVADRPSSTPRTKLRPAAAEEESRVK